MRAIADDLEKLLTSPDEMETVGCRFDGRDCTTENLVRARDFSRRVAEAGFGIHYRIG